MRFSSSSLSLSVRLFLASAVLLPPLLAFSSHMLNHAMLRSQQTAERNLLRGQIHLLLGAAQPNKKGLKLPDNLPESRFSTVNSGLIGWILDSNDKIYWMSKSGDLVEKTELPQFNQPFVAGKEYYASFTLGGEEFYALTYDTLWEINKQDKNYRFVVAHNQGPMQAELNAYQKRLWKWLAGLALLLVIVQTLVTRWGIQPLRRLARDLEQVEAGLSQELTGRYPADIQPVTNNLNRVLRNELAQKERYRNSLNDLAHSLKTPLSVLRGQLQNRDKEQLMQVVDEQVNRMTAIVDHQLRRATAQVTQTLAHNMLDLTPLVQRLINAMHKVYQNKGIQCTSTLPPQLKFPGDEADMMELIGNLIENACKYGQTKVQISAKIEERPIGKELVIVVEDDGPGIPTSLHDTILTRGARADTATAGQGIGLAVAVDILSSYGGSLEITTAALGGAGFILRLPYKT
ncbi:MAG TPA: ATP-binding protein [Cellvibrionaceae bacterium]|nr:ATP-binding protein [Cellvibrionaceae bacterium]HMW73135.1 ATP-binding protein [Cellvibrionaceae bacterium]HNG60601.1 ATP-binding protein [Cellvibrionaceae bacterium]